MMIGIHFILFTLLACLVHGIVDVPESAGELSYFYFNPEAREAAMMLQKYLSDLDEKFEDYLIHLKKENKASEALKEYNEAAASGANSKCAMEIINYHENAQKDIDTLIENCERFVPNTGLQTLSEILKKAVAKVEMVDKTLRLSAKFCSSEKAATLPRCIENKKNALAKLNAIISEKEKFTFEKASKSAFIDIQKSLDSCVEGATKDLENQLKASTKSITDCLTKIPIAL